MPTFDVPEDLVPFTAVQRKEQHQGESARWITKELYTEIQCVVLQRKLQAQVDRARAEGIHNTKAEERLRKLVSATSQSELEAWLQNSTGRAVLSCNACGRVDVDRVLELWSDGNRRRICPECLVARGWNISEIVQYTDRDNGPDMLMLTVQCEKAPSDEK